MQCGLIFFFCNGLFLHSSFFLLFAVQCYIFISKCSLFSEAILTLNPLPKTAQKIWIYLITEKGGRFGTKYKIPSDIKQPLGLLEITFSMIVVIYSILSLFPICAPSEEKRRALEVFLITAFSLWTIHILHQQVFCLFWTHPHTYSEVSNKSGVLRPKAKAEVCQGWTRNFKKQRNIRKGLKTRFLPR